MELKNLEFSNLPDGEAEVRPMNSIPYTLTEKHYDFNSSFVAVIRDRYPWAFKNLSARYATSAANKTYFEFRITRGFIKCNMGSLDNRLDIDENGIFHFEYCRCPLAGECKEWKETCEPQENNEILSGEMRVLRLIAQGKQASDIADELYISRKTVENHTNNMLRKLGVHNNAALVNYWHNHHLK